MVEVLERVDIVVGDPEALGVGKADPGGAGRSGTGHDRNGEPVRYKAGEASAVMRSPGPVGAVRPPTTVPGLVQWNRRGGGA